MSSLLLSRRDLDFLLYEWLDVEELTKRPYHADHSRVTFDAALDLAEQVATRHFATHNKKADAEEPRLHGGRVHLIPEVAEALAVFAETGLLGAAMPYEVGGGQLPTVLTRACFAWFQAANVGTSAYPFLTAGSANLLLHHASPELVSRYVQPMLDGRFFGTMCLSEPQAGSSLADIVTKAVPHGDGTYRLFGNKMWISAGDHELGENIVHLVLAKIPGGPLGVKGISLFVVPKFLPSGERNEVALAGLNHKMGYRGTSNAMLNFGEGSGAVGWLVGAEHQGLTCMFTMMNEARIGVGAGAMALGYTGYLKSLEYARSRPQGRPVGAKDPAAPQVPIIEHPDVRRMLLAQKSYVEGALALNLYCARLLDDERTGSDPERASLLLDVLTPVAKSWPAQWCLEANNLAIQIHGGYGYTREYDVEQHYRDNRLNPIHEGTHGIQGLDLLGRKVVMRGGAGLALLGSLLRETADRATAAGGELAALAGDLRTAGSRVTEVTAKLWSSGDPDLALANASIYLEAVGHTVLAWIWLEQLLVADGRAGDFYAGKRQAGRYFFRYELPKTGPQFALLESLDRTTLDASANWF